MTKQMDRFERSMVKYGITDPIPLQLIRREHAVIVRMVKKVRGNALARTAHQEARDRPHPITAYTLACDDILAMLDKRKK